MNTLFVERLVHERIGSGKVLTLYSLENAGGFSGASIWRVETEKGSLCVRRWPRPHPSKERLAFIHSVLFFLETQRFDLIAAPMLANSGMSWTEFDGHFWEVSKWLPGKSDFWLDSNEAKMRNAITALARFHQICKKNPKWNRRAESPGIAHRWKRLAELDAAQIHRLEQSVQVNVLGRSSPLTIRICDVSHSILVESGRLTQRSLRELAQFTGLHQMNLCLRDIWHDHVLFIDDRVTGLIDYGAINIDVPAGDFARLLGSLAMDNERFWEIGLETIASHLPEMATQIPMIRAIDFANVVLAGLNWINWLFIEKRDFPIHDDVLARLEHIHRRLLSRNQAEFG